MFTSCWSNSHQQFTGRQKSKSGLLSCAKLLGHYYAQPFTDIDSLGFEILYGDKMFGCGCHAIPETKISC